MPRDTVELERDLLQQLNHIHASVHASVCPECDRRKVDAAETSDRLACEDSCDLIGYLPRLIDLVRRFGDELPCGYETAVENLPCRSCDTPACDESCHGSRPLDTYALDVMAIVERVARKKLNSET